MCAQGTIGNVESGERRSVRNLVEIARALDVSIDWLYDGKGQKPANNARGQATLAGWPFSTDYERYSRLSAAWKAVVDQTLDRIIATAEAADNPLAPGSLRAAEPDAAVRRYALQHAPTPGPVHQLRKLLNRFRGDPASSEWEDLLNDVETRLEQASERPPRLNADDQGGQH